MIDDTGFAYSGPGIVPLFYISLSGLSSLLYLLRNLFYNGYTQQLPQE